MRNEKQRTHREFLREFSEYQFRKFNSRPSTADRTENYYYRFQHNSIGRRPQRTISSIQIIYMHILQRQITNENTRQQKIFNL